MQQRHPRSGGEQPDKVALYREMLRAIPGLEAIYRLARALIECRTSRGSRIIVVGAGGGREIVEFGQNRHGLAITAIDPCAAKLALAKRASRAAGLSDAVEFFTARIEDLPQRTPFEAATSLLVMHQIADDGGKLAYLSSIRDRLTDGGVLVHADVCIDAREELEEWVPAYLSHAEISGIDAGATHVELDALSRLPIVSAERTRELFVEAGFAAPREVFRSLWYRCWIATK